MIQLDVALFLPVFGCSLALLLSCRSFQYRVTVECRNIDSTHIGIIMVMNSHYWADMVVFLHATFVLFVLFGGLAALRWRRLAWFHLPAALWGMIIELGGWICPLTYLENHLRRLGGGSDYSVTFIEHYLEPILYPLGLTRHTQFVFALSALLLNLTVYFRFWSHRRK